MDVIAFEPNRENCRVFTINCILNDCEVDLRQTGLGRAAETAVLALSPDNMGNHRIWNSGVENRKTENVRISTFDWEMKRNRGDIGYVWIDVEGYEGYVLEGMRKTLDRKKFPIWMEFCPQMLEESGSMPVLRDMLHCYFRGYIDRHNIKRVCPVDEIDTLAESLKGGNATDLFLIRR